MTNDDFHDLVRRAIKTGRDHIEKNYARRQEPCVVALMDQIELEMRVREIEAWKREHPQLPRINPWGC
jgi:hypothetical protein